jgi:hypothetical protein
MKKSFLFFTIQIMVYAVLISGCKKEKEDPLPTPPPEVLVGQNYGGGIVFYVDGTGKHGLTAATGNQNASAQWFNGNYIETHAAETKIGAGEENTTAIINIQGAGTYAATICDSLDLNGYNDWFLPSKDELNLLYLQKAKGLVSGLVNDFYWSSTESSYNGAWSQSFTSGAKSSTNKDGSYCVCAIRIF